MKTITTIIVDDEQNARERIRTLLAPHNEFEVIAECRNGKVAVKSITELKPSLVFLDIQMPGLNGFEVINSLSADTAPYIVFVTAYDKYAVDAFEVDAIDYLLKPFDRQRFERTLNKIKGNISSPYMDKIKKTLTNILNKSKVELEENLKLERIAVKSSGKIVFVNTSEIDLIESEGNYLRLHCGSAQYMIRKTMHRLLEQLDENIFIRVHRSYTVNVNSIIEMESWFRGEYRIILKNNKKINSSRKYNKAIADLLLNNTRSSQK